MTTESQKASERIHDLFENEVEGRIVDPKHVHELFNDDDANARMDQALRQKKPSVLTRFLQALRG